MVTPSIPGAVFFSANFKAQVTSSWWIGDKAPQATSFTASGSRLSQAEACLSSGFQKAVKFAKLTAFIPGSLSQSPETISFYAQDLFLEYRAWVLAYRALRLAHRFKGKLGLFRDGLGLTDMLQPAIDSVFSCFPLSKLLGRLIWWFPRVYPAWARPPNQLSTFLLEWVSFSPQTDWTNIAHIFILQRPVWQTSQWEDFQFPLNFCLKVSSWPNFP